MALSNQARKDWQIILVLTLIAGAIGLSWVLVRMALGLMPHDWAEIENGTRTGLFLGFCLGVFMRFFIYHERGTFLRRMSFVKGTLLTNALATLVIVVGMIFQRIIYSIIRPEMDVLEMYFSIEIVRDVTFAFVFFLVITFFLQVRRLVGEGTMWRMFTGRYHQPHQENRIYLFLDIKDSTSLAVNLGDEKAHSFITEVFFAADRVITEHRGEILSYNGDELVASWPEAAGLRDAACLRAYQEIIKTFGSRAEEFRSKYGVVPSFWAGLHTGPVVVGECGDSKLSFVHIGDTPNTAARLEHQAKEVGRDCLISDELLAKLDLPEALKTEELGSFTLRGHDHKTKVYALESAQTR